VVLTLCKRYADFVAVTVTGR